MTELINGPFHKVEHNWSDTSIYDANGNVICFLDINDRGSVTESNQEALEEKQSGIADFIVNALNNYKEGGNQTTGLNFGMAIEAMKNGYKVKLSDWADKFAYYAPPAKYPAGRSENSTMIGVFPDDLVPYRGYFALKLPSNEVAIFNPCADELLREDWQIVQ